MTGSVRWGREKKRGKEEEGEGEKGEEGERQVTGSDEEGGRRSLSCSGALVEEVQGHRHRDTGVGSTELQGRKSVQTIPGAWQASCA